MLREFKAIIGVRVGTEMPPLTADHTFPIEGCQRLLGASTLFV